MGRFFVGFKPWGNASAYCAICVFAGSNFLFIKLAVREITPLIVVLMRTSFSVLALSGTMLLLRIHPRLDRQAFFGIVVAGLVNVALPQFLIAWGTSKIPTAHAAILLSTTPLDTLLIQALIGQERITGKKFLALLCGVLGVGFLVGGDAHLDRLHSFTGQIALLMAGFCFASSSIAARKMLQGVHPIVQAWGATCIGWLCLMVFAHASGNVSLPKHPLTYMATATMGIGAGAFSYILFFHLIQAWGPTRTQLVAFGAPVVAGILAVVVLHEALTWQLALGAFLCFVGVGIFHKAHQQNFGHNK